MFILKRIPNPDSITGFLDEEIAKFIALDNVTCSTSCGQKGLMPPPDFGAFGADLIDMMES